MYYRSVSCFYPPLKTSEKGACFREYGIYQGVWKQNTDMKLVKKDDILLLL